jgi:hypothetical protein
MRTTIKPRSKPSKIRMTLTALISWSKGNSKIQITIGATSKRMKKNIAVIFLLRRVHFTPQKLAIEIDRPRDNLVSVTLAMAATEFVEASQV